MSQLMYAEQLPLRVADGGPALLRHPRMVVLPCQIQHPEQQTSVLNLECGISRLSFRGKSNADSGPRPNSLEFNIFLLSLSRHMGTITPSKVSTHSEE